MPKSKAYPALASSNSVLIGHCWGSKLNSGANYKRPYSKTRSSAKAYQAQQSKLNKGDK